MRPVEVIEIGARARAALLRAPRYEVVMRFSRGEVWRTTAGEIVWVDEEADAFSEMGVRPSRHPPLMTHPSSAPSTRCARSGAPFPLVEGRRLLDRESLAPRSGERVAEGRVRGASPNPHRRHRAVSQLGMT